MSFLFPSSEITLEAALRDLANGSPRARAFAAHALGDVSDPAEKRRALDALIRASEDDRPEVRAEACASLGDLGEPSASACLVKRLADGHATVRQNAAIALGSLGNPEAFDALVEALAEGPPDVRFQAATSLAELDVTRAFGPLCEALDDEDPQVVGAAALSLGASGDRRAIAKLVPLLDHDHGGARFDAAYALAELGDPAGRQILAGSLVDIDRAWDAVVALELLGKLDDAELLGRALADRKVPPEATVLAAGATLRIAPDGAHRDAARRVLLAGLAAKKDHVRGLAVEQLGEVAGAWAKVPLEKLAKSGKGGPLLESIAASLQAIDERGSPP